MLTRASQPGPDARHRSPDPLLSSASSRAIFDFDAATNDRLLAEDQRFAGTFAVETAQAEVAFHNGVELAEAGWTAESVTYDDYLVDFSADSKITKVTKTSIGGWPAAACLSNEGGLQVRPVGRC